MQHVFFKQPSYHQQFWSYPISKLVLPRDNDETKKINQEIVSPNVFLIYKNCVCVLMDELILPSKHDVSTKNQRIFYLARVTKAFKDQFTIERDDCIDVMKEGFFYYFIRESIVSTSKTGQNTKIKHKLRLIEEPQPKNPIFIDYTKHLSEIVTVKNGFDTSPYSLKEKDKVYDLDVGVSVEYKPEVDYETNGFIHQTKVYTNMVTEQIDHSGQYTFIGQIRTGGKGKEQVRKLKSTEFYFMNDEAGIPQLYEVVYITHLKQRTKKDKQKKDQQSVVNQDNFEEVYHQILDEASARQVETVRSQLYNKEYEHERALLQISHFKTYQDSLRFEWVNPKNASNPFAIFDLRPNYKFNFYWKFGEGACCQHQNLKKVKLEKLRIVTKNDLYY